MCEEKIVSVILSFWKELNSGSVIKVVIYKISEKKNTQ